jgi:hypothetical protein
VNIVVIRDLSVIRFWGYRWATRLKVNYKRLIYRRFHGGEGRESKPPTPPQSRTFGFPLGFFISEHWGMRQWNIRGQCGLLIIAHACPLPYSGGGASWTRFLTPPSGPRRFLLLSTLVVPLLVYLLQPSALGFQPLLPQMLIFGEQVKMPLLFGIENRGPEELFNTQVSTTSSPLGSREERHNDFSAAD